MAYLQFKIILFYTSKLVNKERKASNGLHICKIMQAASCSTSAQPVILSYSITISDNLTRTLFVHEKKVDISLCPALESVPEYLQPSSTTSFLRLLDSSKVCIGNPEEHCAYFSFTPGEDTLT